MAHIQGRVKILEGEQFSTLIGIRGHEVGNRERDWIGTCLDHMHELPQVVGLVVTECDSLFNIACVSLVLGG